MKKNVCSNVRKIRKANERKNGEAKYQYEKKKWLAVMKMTK